MSIREPTAMDRTVKRAGWSNGKKTGLATLLALGVIGIVLFPAARRWASTEIVVDRARVRTAQVERGTLVRDVSVQGSVVAAFSPTLTSPVRGTVRVQAQAGAVVAAQQPLVSVDSPELASQLEQERSTLDSLAADLERQRILSKQQTLQGEEDLALLEVELQAARRALDRAERIRREGLINAVEYERAQDAVKVGTMQLEAARKRAGFALETLNFEVRDRVSRVERQRLVVTEIERRIADLTLRAPFEGLVSRLEVVDRDSVAEGQPLVTVVDLSALDIEVAVPEAYADDLSVGTPAEITYSGEVYDARLKQIAPEVEGSRVRAVLTFAGSVPDGLKQNQRVATRLILESRPDVLKVARGPFLESGGGHVAYRVDDGIAQQQAIQVGTLSVSEIEIISGLEVGDEIVVSDLSRFLSAQRVRLRQ